MRTVRKMLAFMLAVGLMVSAMSVFAASGDKYYDGGGGSIAEGSNNKNIYQGSETPTNDNTPDDKHPQSGDMWDNGSATYVYDGTTWKDSGFNGSCGGSDSASDSDSKSAVEKEAEARAEAEVTKERLLQEEASAEAVRLVGAASDEGFADVGDMYRAAEKSMSAGEFYNNAVVSTPGIENAMTVGQGGNLIVDGQVTNMSASISKVTNRAYVDSVRIEQEGTVLNVVDVSYPAVDATINFYTPGITGDEDIVALQYNAGTWVEVEVAEVRADHVTLNMKGNGVVAFIAK